MRKNKPQSFESVLETMKAHFGDAAKAFWVYDDDFCPCCMTRRIDPMMYKGKEALSMNLFMYREREALIAYFLCGQCAMEIMAYADAGPQPTTTPLHKSIEANLINAYLRYLASFS